MHTIKSRLIFLLLAFFVLALSLGATFFVSANQNSLEKQFEKKLERPHRENTFVVKFKDGVSKSSIRGVNKALGHVKADNFHENLPAWLEDTPVENFRYIRVDEGNMVAEMAKYARNSLVESVEPVYMYELLEWSSVGLQAFPNDWDGAKHWYFERIGLPELWYNQGCHLVGGNTCGGDGAVIVAVIDTGLALSTYNADFSYPVGTGNVDYDIAFGQASEQVGVNLWQNPGEAGSFADACNTTYGIDMEMYMINRMYSDRFGVVNCALKQFEKEGNPNDDYGHGTYVSGIIASAIDNNAGSVGVAHNVSIMTIKANVPFTLGLWTDAIANSIYYATYHGADVINMSFGHPESSVLIETALDFAVENGVVLVAASGNDGIGNDIMYPASSENVIAVGAVDNLDARASYSSYGPELDFVAPVGGGGIGNVMWQQSLTCMPDCDPSNASHFNTFSVMDAVGTSYAAPQVAAAAALLKGVNGTLTASAIKSFLQDSAVDLGPVGRDNETGYGLLRLENFHIPNEFKNNDTKLSTFTVGGENVLELNNIIVANPSTDPGAELGVADFTAFVGIVATTRDINATRTVALNGSVVADVNLATQAIAEGDVIVVTITAEDQTIGYYKVTAVFMQPVLDLYQVHVGTNAYIYTRRSSDGITWTLWSRSNYVGEATYHSVAMSSHGNYLYQSHVGTDKTIYTRRSTDGLSWTNWQRSNYPGEATNHAVSLASHGNYLYQSHVGTDKTIYTRRSTDGLNWTDWRRSNYPGEATNHAVTLVSHSNYLYQSHVGVDKTIYTRRSTDGLNWTDWRRSNYPGEATNHAVVLASHGSHLYQSHVGGDKTIYTRRSLDGIVWTLWQRGNYAGEATNHAVALASVNEYLYQSHIGTDQRIYTRRSTDGLNWTDWRRSNYVGEATNYPVSIAAF